MGLIRRRRYCSFQNVVVIFVVSSTVVATFAVFSFIDIQMSDALFQICISLYSVYRNYSYDSSQIGQFS